MKSSQVRRCLDYIRFTMEMEGSSLEEDHERLLEDILNGEADACAVINNFIAENNLEVSYEGSEDENSNYPGTKCLVNYFNIKDKAELRRVEHFLVNARIAELFHAPLDMRLSYSYLLAIHERLFGDIYPSAGIIRASKESKSKDFCFPEYIEKNANELFGKLAEENYLQNIDDRDDFINELAFFMGETEALHPFKDGNGRTIRFFFYRLVREAGYEMEWSEADPDRMLEASIAAIDGDYQPLIDCLEEIIFID